MAAWEIVAAGAWILAVTWVICRAGTGRWR